MIMMMYIYVYINDESMLTNIDAQSIDVYAIEL